VLVANELLDAMPVHQVVMRGEGLREVYVAEPASGGGTLVTVEGAPSTPALAAYLEQLDITLEPGWRVEINLRAVEWMRDASRRLARGFLVLFDYGHDARELYSVSHSAGTLTAFERHTMAGPEQSPATPPWLAHPGGQDMTSHVDFTSIRRTAEAERLVTLGFLDQTYFLMGILLGQSRATPAPDALVDWQGDLKTRLALKTLMMPGGLGSTLKVLILGKGVGTPPLVGCSYRVRVT
jgi:SAM-dependent MidA family methyltransferase